MAHLEVEPKKSTPWIWILLGLVALVILFFLLRGCGDGNKDKMMTDTITEVDTATGSVVAATQPDWNKVDFNAPETKDEDITDRDVT
ncbi:MAG: OmpA family protein, partial [Mucilaginibacter sp.]